MRHEPHLTALVAVASVALLAQALTAPLVLPLALANGAALAAFGYDKRAARRGGVRVSERVLHAMGFAGVAGASVGRMLYRHKTLHASFAVSLWVASAGTAATGLALNLAAR